MNVHDVLLRSLIGALALFTAGATTVLAARYLRATWRNGRRAPGRILARHVTEVAAGTDLLVIGFAWAMRAQLYGTRIDPSLGTTIRLWMYLVGMVLLLAGVLDVGRYQRRMRRARVEAAR
jgi:hypothetical protein